MSQWFQTLVRRRFVRIGDAHHVALLQAFMQTKPPTYNIKNHLALTHRFQGRLVVRDPAFHREGKPLLTIAACINVADYFMPQWTPLSVLVGLLYYLGSGQSTMGDLVEEIEQMEAAVNAHALNKRECPTK